MQKILKPGLLASVICCAIAGLAGNTFAEPDRHDSPRHAPSAQEHRSHSDSRRMPHTSYRSPSPGYHVRQLPDRHQRIKVRSRDYYYHQGIFYRPASSGAYVVVRAPLGARVSHLPAGYISFYIGPRHYFYANFTYYLWDQRAGQYVTVEEPEGAESEVVAASNSDSGEIFVYPNRGQSDEQRDFDRYQCYLWAVDQTGYDPGAETVEVDRAGDYRRAISACLEGRGYTVK